MSNDITKDDINEIMTSWLSYFLFVTSHFANFAIFSLDLYLKTNSLQTLFRISIQKCTPSFGHTKPSKLIIMLHIFRALSWVLDALYFKKALFDLFLKYNLFTLFFRSNGNWFMHQFSFLKCFLMLELYQSKKVILASATVSLFFP